MASLTEDTDLVKRNIEEITYEKLKERFSKIATADYRLQKRDNKIILVKETNVSEDIYNSIVMDVMVYAFKDFILSTDRSLLHYIEVMTQVYCYVENTQYDITYKTMRSLAGELVSMKKKSRE